MQYLWPLANEKRQSHAQKDAENDEDTTQYKQICESCNVNSSKG